MTFLIDPTTAWAISLSALTMAGALGWLEWQKVDRWRGWRLAATWVAVISLASLGLRPAWRVTSNRTQGNAGEAIVWTGPKPSPVPYDIEGILKRVPAGLRFALPAAGLSLKDEALAVPDLSYLRRHSPTGKIFHLVGEGLLSSELECLRDCSVTFRPVDTSLSAPAVGFLSYPKEIPLGSPLVVQGRVDGLSSGMPVVVSLLAPDGTLAEKTVEGGGIRKSAEFEIKSAPLAAAGKFVWKLRVAAADAPGKLSAEEEIGIEIVDAPMPRVLILESSPHPDTAALRRWMERMGGTMTSRTQVGLDRYRFASTHGAPGEFTVLNESRLAGFDLVLTDPAAIAALPPADRALLTRSVAATGLGILVVGAPTEKPSATKGDAALPAENDADNLSSLWKLSSLESTGQDEAATPRLVRPQWVGQTLVSDVSIPAESAEILPSGERWDQTMTDGQGHVLAARIRQGQGRIGLTLVRDTWRWLLENDQAAFASYWSLLFSKLARLDGDTNAGRWSLLGGNAGPLFTDEPLSLNWTGSFIPTQRATVVCDKDSQTTELALAEDANDSRRWTGTYWPRTAGWHRVTLPATGASMDFFINGNTWEHLRASRRRAATERFAALSQAHQQTPDARKQAARTETTPFSSGWLFLSFFVSAGFLWGERYMGTRAASKTAGVRG